jgi:hypothetical protein
MTMAMASGRQQTPIAYSGREASSAHLFAGAALVLTLSGSVAPSSPRLTGRLVERNLRSRIPVPVRLFWYPASFCDQHVNTVVGVVDDAVFDSQRLDLPQPARQSVPTGERLVHHLKSLILND